MVYTGDDKYAGFTVTKSFTVEKYATTVTIAVANSDNLHVDDYFDITVTVNHPDASQTPTGNVTIQVGSNAYNASLNSNGVATIHWPHQIKTDGSYIIEARYREMTDMQYLKSINLP